MPRRPVYKQLTAWSYHVYTQYMKCPYQVCLEKIQRIKMPEERNDTMDRGTRLHDQAQKFVVGVGTPDPTVLEAPLQAITPRLKEFRKQKAKGELEVCFNASWNPVSWFARDAWLRMKFDVFLPAVKPPTLTIVDYKTGKVYDDHAQQRSLYALGGLRLVQIGQYCDGDKKTVATVEHIYLDTKQSATEVYPFKQLEPLRKEWMARIDQMMSDTRFEPIEGFHCRWCKFRKSAGGPCPIDQ